MKYILLPHLVDKVCTLIEALYWIAFKAYPVTTVPSDDHPFCDPIVYKNYANPQSKIPSEYYPKKILIESPFDIPEGTGWNPTDWHYEMIDVAPINEEDKNRLIKERDAKQTEINIKNIRRQETIEKYLEPAKAKLFQALKERKIIAHGFIYGEIYSWFIVQTNFFFC